MHPFNRIKQKTKKIFSKFVKKKQTNYNYTKFILLSTARTGTTLLYSYLNSHSKIICFREIFGQKEKIDFGHLLNEYNHLSKNNKILNLRLNNPIQFINKYIFNAHSKKIKSVGFKFFYYHPSHYESWIEIISYLQSQKDIKIIHLLRKNQLDTFFSLQKAHKTKVWNVWTKDDENKTKKSDNYTLELNPEACLNYFQNTEENIENYTKIFKDHEVLNIYYEDLLNNKDEILNKLQAFLNVPEEKMITGTKKLNKKNISDSIENYQQLKQKFTDTQYFKFFK